MKVGMISLLNGSDEGKTFLLKNLSVFEAGRSQGNHVLLKDPSVAMSHFRICRTNEDYLIYDLGAKNGTMVNGGEFEKISLNEGDLIQAGEVQMRFDMVDEDTPGQLASCAPQIEVVREDESMDDQDEAIVELVDEVDTDESPEMVEAFEAMNPLFEIVEGEEKGKILELVGQDQFTIGRSTNADLRLKDSKVSRIHSIVELVKDHFIISDNGSSNGTVVNGEKIKKTVLKDGDYIRLGFSILRFSLGAE